MTFGFQPSEQDIKRLQFSTVVLNQARIGELKYTIENVNWALRKFLMNMRYALEVEEIFKENFHLLYEVQIAVTLLQKLH